METSKVKRFIFAPKNESLKAALESQSNNVRKSVYLSPYSEEEFMRIRVRNHSNTTQGICRALAHRVSPITYYKLHAYGHGDELCSAVVGTIRVENKPYDEVVQTVKKVLDEVRAESKIFLKLKVSDILAKDETPWVEVFCSKNRRLTWNSGSRSSLKSQQHWAPSLFSGMPRSAKCSFF